MSVFRCGSRRYLDPKIIFINLYCVHISARVLPLPWPEAFSHQISKVCCYIYKYQQNQFISVSTFSGSLCCLWRLTSVTSTHSGWYICQQRALLYGIWCMKTVWDQQQQQHKQLNIRLWIDSWQPHCKQLKLETQQPALFWYCSLAM